MIPRSAQLAIAVWLFATATSSAQSSDTSATGNQPSIPTAEQNFAFTERSPLSTQKEIARRLNVPVASLGTDYDLSKLNYWAYIPTTYDPNTSYGLFVYLGYKDTTTTPHAWWPILEQYHLIFISPVCHSGTHFQPSVPLWQSVGMAFDAVHNLKKQYNIDDRRLYLMTWAEDSVKTSLSTSDVFTGFVTVGDPQYCMRIDVPGIRYYPPDFAPPPGNLMTLAKKRAFFWIDDGDIGMRDRIKLIHSKMTSDGFKCLKQISLSYTDDLHYPNMKVDWFEQQALPFLDKSVGAGNPVAKSPGSATKAAVVTAAASKPSTVPAPEIAPAPATAPASPPAVTESPQHLLVSAEDDIANGQNDSAKKKLQEIIDTYPNDPAAQTAKDLISQMNP